MDDHGLHLPQHEPPPSAVDAMTAPVRAKRRQVKNACTHCQKACKKCDDARPCLRCVKYGVGEECVDSVRKERKKGLKRGPYKKRDGNNNPLTGQNGPAIKQGLDAGELLLFPPEHLHPHQQQGIVYYQYPPHPDHHPGFYPPAANYYHPPPVAFAHAQEEGFPAPPPAVYYAHAPPPPPYYPPQPYAYPAPVPAPQPAMHAHQHVRIEQAQYAYGSPEQQPPPLAPAQIPQEQQYPPQQVPPPQYGQPVPSYTRAPVPEGEPLARVNEPVQEGVPLAREHEVQPVPPEQQASYIRGPAQDSVPLTQAHARAMPSYAPAPGPYVGGIPAVNAVMPMEGRA